MKLVNQFLVLGMLSVAGAEAIDITSPIHPGNPANPTNQLLRRQQAEREQSASKGSTYVGQPLNLRGTIKIETDLTYRANIVCRFAGSSTEYRITRSWFYFDMGTSQYQFEIDDSVNSNSPAKFMDNTPMRKLTDNAFYAWPEFKEADWVELFNGPIKKAFEKEGDWAIDTCRSASKDK